MKRTEIDEYIYIEADEGKQLLDTRYNLVSKTAVCLPENEKFIVEK